MFDSHITDELTTTSIFSNDALKAVRADVWSSDEMLGLNLLCNVLSATTPFTVSNWNGPRTAKVYNECIHYKKTLDDLGVIIICNPNMDDSYVCALVDTFVSSALFQLPQVFESNNPNYISIVKNDFILLVSTTKAENILESFYFNAKEVGLYMTESSFSSPFGDNISPALILADTFETEFTALNNSKFKYRDFLHA